MNGRNLSSLVELPTRVFFSRQSIQHLTTSPTYSLMTLANNTLYAGGRASISSPTFLRGRVIPEHQHGPIRAQNIIFKQPTSIDHIRSHINYQDIVNMSTCTQFTVAIAQDGLAYIWDGHDDRFETDSPTIPSLPAPLTLPTHLLGTLFESVTCGANYFAPTCALISRGDNQVYMLRSPYASAANVLIPCTSGCTNALIEKIPLAISYRAVQVSIGYDHIAMLTEGGSVWCWGSNFNFKLGVNAINPFSVEYTDYSADIVQAIDVTDARMISTTRLSTMAMTAPGAGQRVWYWGGITPQTPTLLTSLPQIVQITGSSCAHYLLSSTGLVYVYLAAEENDLECQFCAATPKIQPEELTLIRWPLNVLPLSFTISKLVSCGSCQHVFAIATASSTAEVPLQLPQSLPSSTSRLLISWGFPQPSLGNGQTRTLNLQPPSENSYKSPDHIQTSHLPGDFRNITKYCFSTYHTVALTSVGEILSAGDYRASPAMDISKHLYSKSLFMQMENLLSPSRTVDIACGTEATHILSELGIIVEIASPNVTVYSGPNEYISVSSYRYTYSALDQDRSLYLWGGNTEILDVLRSIEPLARTTPTIAIDANINGSVLHYGHTDQLLVLLLDAAPAPRIVLLANSLDGLTENNSCVFFGFYCQLNPGSLDTNSIVQIVVSQSQQPMSSHFVVFLTNTNQLYYMGSIEGSASPVPTLMTSGPLPNTCTIKKIAAIGSVIQVLCTNGKLYTTSEDPEHLFGRSELDSIFKNILPEFKVLDIFSGQVHDNTWAVQHHYYALVAPGSTATKSYQSTERISIAFGNNAGGVLGLGTSSAWEYPTMLPPGHPIHHPNASEISLLGYASMKNGEQAYRWGNIGAEMNLNWKTYFTYPSAIATTGVNFFTTSLKNAHFQVSEDCLAVQFIYIPVENLNAKKRDFTHGKSKRSVPSAYSDTAKVLEFGTLPTINLDPCDGTVLEIKCASAHLDFNSREIQAVCGIRTENDMFMYGFGSDRICSTRLLGAEDTCLLIRQNISAPGIFGQYPLKMSGPLRLDLTTMPAGTSITQFDLGTVHGILLNSDKSVAVWGTNTNGQLAVSDTADNPFGGFNKRDSAQIIDLPTIIDPNSIPGTPIKVVASALNSYLLMESGRIFGVGDNTHGQLGNPTVNSPNSATWVQVSLPDSISTIKDFKCAAFTCYVLDATGRVWSWGSDIFGLLARSNVPSTTFGASKDPTPLLTNRVSVPEGYKISQIITSSTAASVILRTEPPVLAPPCIGTSPGPQFSCVGGIWVLEGNLVIGNSTNTTTVVISGPTTVTGNVTVPPGTTLVIQPGSLTSGSTAILNINGCIILNGTLEIEIDAVSWNLIKNELDGKTQALVATRCGLDQGVTNVRVKSPKDCRKVSSQTKTTQTDDGALLTALFKVDSKRCNIWWIVLVSVLAAVVVISAAVMIAWKIHVKRKYEKAKQSVAAK